jgi:hypothetical protein
MGFIWGDSMRRFVGAVKQHPWLVSGVVIAFAVTLFFVVRIVVFTIYWSDPAHRDQQVQAWMTPGYVAKSWGVPREDFRDLFDGLNLPMVPKPIGKIAAENDITLVELIAQIEAAIAAHRANQ